MANTLAAGLQSASVDFDTLHKRYHPALALVKELIGIVPNCDPCLEIWPVGFQSYNLLVPNLFNLPNLLFGKKSFKASVGLAMYTASKTASCAYCTAHTCSFALRRGTSVDAIQGIRTAKEQAVVRLAEGLSHIPADLKAEDVDAVSQHFSQTEVEWLVLSISMMGFLNKFMNAMGIELEQDAINDTAGTLAPTGWEPGHHAWGKHEVTKTVRPKKDSLTTYLRVIRQAPGAISLEKKWTKGVPGDYAAAAVFLEQHTGYLFPLLKPLKQGRVVRAIATVLRDNLNTEVTDVGLRAKMLAAYLFARLVANEVLINEVISMALKVAPELDDKCYKILDEIADADVPGDSEACEQMMRSLQRELPANEEEATAMLLALAAAPSPAQVNEAVREEVLSRLKPASIVELSVWLSVMQMLQRLSSYYAVVKAY